MLNLETRMGKPPRILIYGPPKIGKSTFGAMALDPVVIQTENGLDDIDVPAFPLATSFEMVMDQLSELASTEHDRKTVVIDSVDWLETLIWKQVAAEQNKPSLEDIGYGKGYVMAMDVWAQYLSALNYLRDERGMTVIQIGHSEIKRYENPETDGYDRFQIKLHKLAAAKLTEYSDIVLFVNYLVHTKKAKDGNEKKTRAIGGSERILYTQERASFYAGSRYNLPAEMPFTRDGNYWNEIANAVPFYREMAAGAVTKPHAVVHTEQTIAEQTTNETETTQTEEEDD